MVVSCGISDVAVFLDANVPLLLSMDSLLLSLRFLEPLSFLCF